MKLSRTARATLLGTMIFGFTFIYLPLALVVINSFNTNKSFAWPPTGFTTVWWSKAAANDGIRDAVMRSVITALIATSIALILGSLAAAAISRYEFFGRDAISLLFVFLYANTELHQLLKLPMLIHHYLSHHHRRKDDR